MKLSQKPLLFSYPLMLIEWLDSNQLGGGWMDSSRVPDPFPRACISIGFVVSECPSGKVLVPTIEDVEATMRGRIYGGVLIPARSIISERVLAPVPGSAQV